MNRSFVAGFLVSLLMLTVGIRAFAQAPADEKPSTEARGVIAGVVLDRSTESSIPGAVVELLDTKRGAITRVDGTFRIEGLEPGIYRIRVSSIGYESTILTDIEVSPARPQTVRVELNETMDGEGETIIVRPDYFDRRKVETTSTRDLQAEEIRRLPGGFEDVVRAISTLPGVAQVSNGRNDLLVRGGAPSENLFLIDGVESPNINHFGTQGAGGGPLSFVNLDFVRQTTFSTGGFGAKYGDKISSVLTIDMREGRDDRIGGKGTISASQFGLNLEGPVTQNGSWLFSARRSYLDLIFRAAGFSFVPEYWDFFGKFNYTLGPNDRLSGLAIAAIDRVRFFNDDADARFDNSRILNNSQDQLVGGVTWKHLFENGYLNATLGRTRIDYQFGQTDSLLNPIFTNNSLEDEFNLRVDLLHRFSDGLELSFGGNAKTIGFDADIFLAQGGSDVDIRLEDRFYKGAFYVQASRPIVGDLIATLGGRLDYFSGIEEKYAPSLRLAVTAPVGDLFNVNLSGGRYYQAPSYIWLAANEENRKLKSIRTDVGVLGFDRLLAEDVKVSLEGYVKLYNDYPASLSRPYLVLANTGAGFGGSDEGFASFGLEPLASLGEGRAWGAELFFQKKLSTTPWYGVASLSYNNGTFTAIDGVERPGNFDQRITFNLSGGWRITDRWEVGMKFRFATGRPYTPVDSTGDPTFGYRIIDQYNALRLDPAHALDLRLDKRWPFSRWNLITYIDVQNVYNRRNPDVPRYSARLGGPDDSESAIGILPSIGISAEW